MARKKSAAKRAREAAEKLAGNKEVEKEATGEISKKTPAVEAEILESESDSTSEEEDDYGNLITEDVEAGINSVLEALKKDPKRLLDQNTKFFDDNQAAVSGEKREKPMYLKDYHRMNLLSGAYKEDNEYGTVDGEKPFVVAEREERNQLLSDIKNAVADDSDEDDDFLVKKGQGQDEQDAHVTRMPDSSNQEEFLASFFDQQAWIPRKNDKVINLDKIDQEDEEEFDNAVEKLENAYNFRFEEENSAEILSYARSQATLRRSKTNARKRQREKKQEEKAREETEKEEELKKRKLVKANKVMDRLAQIKEAVGDEVPEEVIEKVFGDALLKDDFDDTDWDNKMAEIFNEQYYSSEKKPEWDDMDMGEEDDKDVESGIEAESENDTESRKGNESEDNDEHNDHEHSSKSRKDKKSDKKRAKLEKKSLREKAMSIVESNATQILEEIEEERGRAKDEEVKFRYREVSPESFGLTTRDILVADDGELNNYIGLKKFAPYRAKELRTKDKRKYAKKKQLQQWRKDVLRGKKNIGGDETEVWFPAEKEQKRAKGVKEKKSKSNR